MDLKAFLEDLVERYFEKLTVDRTSGGVKFDPDKLSYEGLPAKVVRCTLEGGDIRYQSASEPSAATADGDLMVAGDEWFVPGQAAPHFRAFQVGANPGTIRYHVYF